MTFFATINADTTAKKQAAKAAGCTHLVVLAFWGNLQLTQGGALDATALAALNAELDDCRSIGLAPILSHSIQYPPSWALTAVEAFKDQAGNTWAGTGGSGGQVRNWMWTATGRGFVSDFLTKVYAGLSTANRAAIARVRFGGGYFDELQYPPQALASPNSYWGFGASQQSGTDLASGLSVCPLPGYTPFTGTDAQDVQWINWYLGGIENWLKWYITTLKAIGWTCRLSVCHPGYSTRTNQVRSDAAYRQSMAFGHDFTRAVGIYKNDPQVWPWSTWINGPASVSPPVLDTDQAAWQKLYAEAAVRGKAADLWGENTGGEANSGMDTVFTNALSTTPASGSPIYSGSPRGSYAAYQGLMWLDDTSLNAGGSNATLAHYQTKISGG